MKADVKTIRRLLNTARGQLQGVLSMVEEDKYCVDISNQIMAAQAILTKANRMILKAHMENCVREAAESGEGVLYEEKIQEVLALIDRMNR